MSAALRKPLSLLEEEQGCDFITMRCLVERLVGKKNQRPHQMVAGINVSVGQCSEKL
jgi:hypothetical protein